MDLIDTDKSNDVNKNEMKWLLDTFAENLDIPVPNQTDIDQLFSSFEAKNSITKEEFSKILKKIIQRLAEIVD